MKKIFQNPVFYLALATFSFVAHKAIFSFFRFDEPFFFTLFFASSFLFVMFLSFSVFRRISDRFRKDK